MAKNCPACRSDNPADTVFCGKCGAPLPSAAPPGDVFTETIASASEDLTLGAMFAGRYQIIEELGHGGMGRVYRALDMTLHEEVALKLIRPEIALDKKTLERFRNELKLARKISHRNVGRMYELMESRRAHFITMEYVPGEDLRSFIRRSGQLTVGKTLAAARQICDGLDEAHRQGIIHRDLKPSNIIIDREGNAKIMDFGIARSLASKSATGRGVMIGTPEYMSPEQVEGRDVGPRADIYSLGIIIYEMLTGRVPFEGDTPFSVGVKQKSEKPKDPREFNAGIPEDLSRLILLCLEKEIAKRPAGAAEVRVEIERIATGLPTTERFAPLRKTQTGRQVTVTFTMKKALLPAAAVLALIAALVVLRVVPARKGPSPSPSGKPSLAIVYFENISGDPSLDDWKTGLPELLTTDLAQSKFLTVLSGEATFGILRKLNLLEAKKYSTEDLAKISEEGRVGYILNGGIMKAGEKIIITARLQKPKTGDVIETKKIECAGEADIPAKVDDLTRMVKADLNLTPQQISGDIDKAVGQITTASAEAMKFYVEARKKHLAMQYRDALPLYEKAVTLDPGFAMAYRGLSTAHSNMGFIKQSREAMQKAMAHADRISDRERLLILARIYYESERTYDKAIETYDQLMHLYPDDILALNGLGNIYSSLQEYDRALPFYERYYAIAPDTLSCYNVALTFELLGRFDRARKVFEDSLRSAPPSPRIQAEIGRIALNQGFYDEARREADKAFLIDANSLDAALLGADVHRLQGNLEEAEKDCRAVLLKWPKAQTAFFLVRLILIMTEQGRLKDVDKENERLLALANEMKNVNVIATTNLFGSSIEAGRGHPERALEMVESSLKVYRDLNMDGRIRSALLAKGRYFLLLNAIDKAAAVESELRALVLGTPNKKAVRYADLLAGEIELRKKNAARAIELLEAAAALLPVQTEILDDHATFLEPLARAYEKAGNDPKAREAYERIANLTVGRFAFGPIYVRAFFNLGAIAERQGDKARAREQYQKFLTVLKNADPGYPDVETAKKRLAALIGS